MFEEFKLVPLVSAIGTGIVKGVLDEYSTEWYPQFGGETPLFGIKFLPSYTDTGLFVASLGIFGAGKYARNSTVEDVGFGSLLYTAGNMVREVFRHTAMAGTGQLYTRMVIRRTATESPAKPSARIVEI